MATSHHEGVAGKTFPAQLLSILNRESVPSNTSYDFEKLRAEAEWLEPRGFTDNINWDVIRRLKKRPKRPPIKEQYGIATSDDCPRKGYVRMWTKFGQQVTIPTRCKTWKCNACREVNKHRVMSKISSGCSQLVVSWLITLTYHVDGDERRHAASVKRDWRVFLRYLRRKYQKTPWFRIIEATKRGQPHLHLIMGGLGGKQRVACDTGKRPNGKCAHKIDYDWAMQDCANDCIEHELAKVWYRITGDSFVIDARRVVSANGAAAYLSKYLTKATNTWEYLESLGFRKRYSASRDWPKRPTMLMRGSEEGWWVKFEYAFAGDAGSVPLARQAKKDEFSPFKTLVVPYTVNSQIHRQMYLEYLAGRKQRIYRNTKRLAKNAIIRAKTSNS